MNSMNATEIEIIGSHFNHGFSLMFFGQVRRFGSCEWHDDKRAKVIAVDGKFFLVSEDSRDNGFKELSRSELSQDTLATYGYHDDEHGEWMTLAALLGRQNPVAA